MKLNSVLLQNFRCFEFSKFDNFSDVTYIVGQNGSGKTSILEGISLIGGQSSFRAKTMDHLIKDGIGAFEVAIDTDCGKVFIGYNADKKTMEIDGDKVSANFLKKTFSPIVFSPNHELSLTTQSLTRNFIDKLASFLFNDHEKFLNKYKELTSERLKILLLNESKAWLDSIEEQIAEHFVVIVYNRLNFINKIQSFFEEIKLYNSIDINDNIANCLKQRETFSNLEKKIKQLLENARQLDRSTNRNSISINSANYDIVYDRKKIEFCSSGQQKMMGAILTLATGYFAKKNQNGVIIILDDITAKIDDVNQEYLKDVIKFCNCQTIISTIEHSNKNDNCIFL